MTVPGWGKNRPIARPSRLASEVQKSFFRPSVREGGGLGREHSGNRDRCHGGSLIAADRTIAV